MVSVPSVVKSWGVNQVKFLAAEVIAHLTAISSVNRESVTWLYSGDSIEFTVPFRRIIADQSGGKVGYQTLINSALRDYVDGKTPKWEETLRRIIREELGRNNAA